MAYLHWFTDQHCSNCGRTSDYQLLHAQPLAIKSPHLSAGQVVWTASDNEYRVLCSCNHCKYPHTLDLKTRPLNHAQTQKLGVRELNGQMVIRFLNRLSPVITHNSMSTHHHGTAMSFTSHEWGQKLNDFFEIIARYPESTLNPPSALPSDLAADFEDLAQVQGSTRHTVIACRHLLERACKKALGDEADSDKLVKLIDQALNRIQTVKAIADWAHTIRVLGNEAVHGAGDPPTRPEAEEAVRFTTLFLELLFSYPERIKSLRQ